MAYALERFWDLILAIAIAIQRLSRRGIQSVQTLVLFLCCLFIELEFSPYHQTCFVLYLLLSQVPFAESHFSSAKL